MSLLATAACLGNPTRVEAACTQESSVTINVSTTSCINWTSNLTISSGVSVNVSGTDLYALGYSGAGNGALQVNGTTTRISSTATIGSGTGQAVAGVRIANDAVMRQLYNYGTIQSAGSIDGAAAGVTDNVIGGVVVRSGAQLGSLLNGISATISASGTLTGTVNGNSVAGVANLGGTISSLLNYGLIAGSATHNNNSANDTLAAIINTGLIQTLTNSGTIQGQNTGGRSTGVSGIFNASTGTITRLESNAGRMISANTGVRNQGRIGALVNAGTINGDYIGLRTDGGSIGTLDNSGTITSNSMGIYSTGTIETVSNSGHMSASLLVVSLTSSGGNAGYIGTFTNESGGTITSQNGGGLEVGSGGRIGTLTNAGTLITVNSGVAVAAMGGATIDTLINNGTISGGSVGIYVGGTLTSITNTGLLKGGETYAISVDQAGVIGQIENSGTIAGNILHNSIYDITFSGGSGSQFGTLTGTSGGIGLADKGTITSASGGNIGFAAGNILLNDDVEVIGSRLNNFGATLRLANAVNVQGSYHQTAGVLELAGNTLTVTENFSLTGGAWNVTLGAPSATALVSAHSVEVNGGTLNITGSAGFDDGTYLLVSYDSTGSFDGLGFSTITGTGDYEYSLAVNAVSHVLTLVVQSGLYWNGTYTGGADSGVFGGSGVWTAGASGVTNWTNSSGTTNRAWNDGSAIFSGTAGTVTIDDANGAVSAKKLRFLTTGYEIAGDELTLNGTTSSTSSSAPTVEVVGAPTVATISAVIAGSTGLEKIGAGTLVLTGDNTYSGTTTISAGTLSIGNGGTSGAVSGDIVNNANLEFNRSDYLTYAGVLSGGGNIAKLGTGTLILTGQNTYTGTLAIAGGTVQISEEAALGQGNLALSGAGTLEVGGNTSIDHDVSLAAVAGAGGGTFQVDDGVTVWVYGDISGDGSLTKTGTGTLRINSTNAATGATNVNAGTLVANGGAALADTSAVTVATGAQLTLRASETIGSLAGDGVVFMDQTVSRATRGITLTTGGNNASSSFSGAITGTGELTKTGAGTLTLSGANTFTGPTTVSSGALKVDGSLAGDVTVESGSGLSGTGSIAQTVYVLSGGGLAGALGSTGAGGLTMGALELSAGAVVSVSLGAPSDGTVFNVLGDLTLNGTLNARATTGFGVGLYHIFSYGGTLTDDGMVVGNVPTGYLGGLQTSVVGEVNLFIEDAQSTLQFWNGSNTTATGTVLGGDGTWTAAAQTNWTNASATVPQAWNAGYAIFQGSPGTVTVDNTGGQVSATGMQFVTSGYLITGGDLALVGTGGAAPVIRVGDSTLEGAGTYATIASVLTGTSGLEKTDYGTLILTGANTYTGGTTISAGTLQLGDGVTNGSILGDVVNNGTLAFELGGDTGFAGAISGTGALTVQGWGTLALTGANSYAGGTTVNNGTLQIAQAGALGTGGLTLSDNATLRASGTFTYGGAVTLVTRERFTRAEGPLSATVEVDPSQTLTLSGVISGEGALTKTGAGLLILTGNNTYTGLTTIDAGTLQIGNGGTTGGIVGDVVNNATLVFNRSDTYTFTGAITGAGAVTFMGGGTVLFSSPYTGAVSVEQSVVTLVDGSTTTSPFTVNSGGTIGGSATIGGLTVNAGGTAAPGYSPGTITVAGPVTFNSGSVYLVDVTPAGEHDLITATGAVTLSSGASVAVNATPGRYEANSTVTILTTSSTLTGTFGSVSSNYAFLAPELSYDAQNVYLTLVYSGIDFSTYAVTPNEYRTAVAAQALGSGSAVFDAIVGLPQGSVAPAFDQLSGEIYASVGTVIQQEAVYLRDAVGTRLRQSVTPAGTGPLAYASKAAGPATAQLSQELTPTLWMQGYGGWGNAFGNGNAASISSSVGGVFGGLDVNVTDGVRAGLVAGFSQTRFDVGARSSSGSMDNYDIGLYAGGQFGAFALRGGLSYTWHDISVSRTMLFPGFAGSAKGGDTVGTTQVFGEVGYGVDVGAYSFEPFAGLAYVNVSGGSLSENGLTMSGAGLNVNTGSMDTVYSTLGLRAATTMTLGGHVLTPSASIGWQHAFGDTSPVANMVFQNGALPFQVSGVPVAEDALLVGAGLAYDLSDIATLQVNYTGQLAGAAAQNAFSAQFSLKF
ncbi:autotransporter domain-containing protein [Azorhizobium oxalatiphilum]|uniref:autotransporter domain-containing protein n=1 Tax=Azorhizobium oxalatiphilum TaxID=980631 RepID=UPI00166A2363|nr:autotransporter domain-containing protein [Azorhizobium oxalatiphilum]